MLWKPLESANVKRLLLALAFLLSINPRAGIASEAKPEKLSLRNLQGERVRLQSYRGNIVVLNFWATWCGPCREELPMIAAAEREWDPKGVIFIAASLDEKRNISGIPAFLEKYRVELPVWTGATAGDLDRFRLGNGIPNTVFLDRNGSAVFRVMGEIHKPELEERLKWLTSDHKATAPAAVIHNM